MTPTGSVIEDMYLCQWSDVDLGDSGDDFAGCDTVLSLGFVYNGKPVDAQYADFDLKPPASGYDFLQGPKVKAVAGQDLNKNGIDDADSREFAIFDLKRITGYVNLPMTSFIYFAAGGRYEDPPFTQSGGIRWYQMFRGLPPDPLGPPDPDPLAARHEARRSGASQAQDAVSEARGRRRSRARDPARRRQRPLITQQVPARKGIGERG